MIHQGWVGSIKIMSGAVPFRRKQCNKNTERKKLGIPWQIVSRECMSGEHPPKKDLYDRREQGTGEIR